MANEMAMLTEKRLKEMEAEMNRFEQEILTPKGSEGVAQGRIIIGSNTFHQVQAKITHGDGPPRKMARPDSHSQRTLSPEPKSDSNIPLSVLSAPPPPPPSLIGSSQPSVGGMPPMAPPPPPPSSSVRPSLSFVPPQIRHRNAPPPPPPRAGPPMHGPPRPPPYMGHNGPPAPPPGIHGPGPYGGPHGGPHGHPPPHMMHPRGPPMPGPYGGPHGPMSMGPGYGISSGDIHHALNTVRDGSGKDSEESATIEKPRVVYSSAPVIKTSEKKKKKKKDTEEKEKETSLEDSSKAAEITESSVTGGITAGPAVIPTTVIPEAQDHLQEAEIETDTSGKKGKKDKKKKYIRTAAGQVWEDNSLDDWDTDDFRIFCGDLGNEVTDEVLARAFSKFPSFQKAKVVRDKRTNKTRGYGFVSFKDPNDFVQAMREMNGKYVGNRPIKLRKSQWKDRSIDIVRKKEKEKKRLGLR